ncbi:MAG: APC family permease [Sandaracinaceae bacterium]
MTEPVENERPIRTRTAALLAIASMVGTGVFASSGLLLADLHSVPAVLLAWAAGGILAVCGALSYAELVAALPKNGGEYHLLGTVYHPALGFASGLVSFVVGFVAANAACALAFGEFLRAAWPELAEGLGWASLHKSLAPVEAPPIAFETVSALALLVVMTILHAARPGAGRVTQDLLTVVKLVLIAAFIVMGLGSVDPARLAYSERPLWDACLSPAFAVALVYVSFSYSGWNAAAYVAGELRDPERSVPRALLGGTLVVVVLYVALNAVFLGGAPAAELTGQIEVAHIAAEHLFGDGAARGLSAIIAWGLVSTVGALTLTGARVLDAMGRDHGPLALLARRAAGGPTSAVLLSGVGSCALALTSSFANLLEYIGFTLSVFAWLTVLGVFVLRWRRPDLARPYHVWGYPLTPALFVLGTGWMIVWSVKADPRVPLAGCATILAGALVYGFVKRASPA